MQQPKPSNEEKSHATNGAVLVTAFNRPDFLMTLLNILKPLQLRVYVHVDGPREANNHDQRGVRKIKNICSLFSLTGAHFHDSNLGCKEGMECGLDWFFQCEPEGIILEDDVVPTAAFIRFALEMLEIHRDNHSIWMVAGHPQGLYRSQKVPTYLTKYSHIWGWASWASSWKMHEKDLTWWSDFKRSDKYRKTHPLKSERQYWNSYMKLVSNGAIDTWDLQFQASMWRNEGLSVSSTKRLVNNVGFRADATHTRVKPYIFVRPLERFFVYRKKPPKLSRVGDLVEFLEISRVQPWPKVMKKIRRFKAIRALG